MANKWKKTPASDKSVKNCTWSCNRQRVQVVRRKTPLNSVKKEPINIPAN